MGKLLSVLLGLVAFGLVTGGLFLGGFLVSYLGVGPFNGFADRIDRNLSELRGEPSPLEQRVNVIETTNVRLRGTIYPIPRREFTSGGALAPWGDDLLVLNRRGTIRRLVEGEGVRPTSIQAPDNGLEAYEALAVSEEYASFSHRPDRQRFNDLMLVDSGPLHGLVISYSFFDADEVCYGSRVAWLEVPRSATAATLEAAPEDWEVIFQTSPCLELNPTWTAFDGIVAGGRMAFEAPSTIYFGSGDYHLDGVHTYDIGLQSSDNDYGKVIAIDLATREAQHHSIGHRNMQGVAIDTAGRLWTTEHMVRGGDELNLIEEGANYGWPLETYGTLYSGLPFPNQGQDGRHVLHTAPTHAWLPSAGVSTLAAIDGFHPTWDGDLLAGSLAGPEHGQSLFRIRIEDGHAVFAERIRLEERIRYVTQWGPDRIAVLIDIRNAVLVLRAEERVDVLARALAQLETQIDAETHAQVTQVARSCNECHSFERGVQATGPSLAGVVGRDIGGALFENYSPAMASQGGVWDRETLVAYLTDPESVVSGTSMPAQGLEPGAAVEGLIDLLEIVGSEAADDLPYN